MGEEVELDFLLKKKKKKGISFKLGCCLTNFINLNKFSLNNINLVVYLVYFYWLLAIFQFVIALCQLLLGF